MKTVTKEVLKECASRLMFDMSEEQYDTLMSEFEIITQQMELIKEIPGVDEVTPMTFPFKVYTSYLREDKVEEPLAKEDVLRNSAEVMDGQIKLPKVVG